MKSDHQKRVEEFMLLAKQEVPSKPCLPSLNIRKLRATLILEEALETIEALGFTVYAESDSSMLGGVRLEEFRLIHDRTASLEEVIDGLCDLSVVGIGTAIACGVPLEPFIEEVDNNNLAKFGPGHTIREDGKLVKPPNHKPPKIKEILATL